MADWRTISVALKADTTAYTSSLNSAAKATQQFGADANRATASASKAMDQMSGASSTAAKKMQSSTSTLSSSTEQATGKMSSAWRSMGAVSTAVGTAVGFAGAQLGTKLLQIGVDAVKSATDFQAAMLNVQSLGEESATSITRLSDAVLRMSQQLPQSAGVLAAGLYDIESSGFSGAAALDVLRSSGVAASAGMTDTATSARAITAVLNSYGLAGSDAQHVSDVLFQTVNVGVVSFEELAQNIGDVVPMAAAMGISLEQATGAMATMTLAGLPAAEAATSTARVMQSFIKPSASMADEMNRLGISLDSLKDPAFGLSGAMQAISKDTGGSIVAMQAMFPDVRSLRGALALTANEGATYARVMRSQGDASKGAGAATEAFRIQMRSLSAQYEILKNRIGAISIGAITATFPAAQRLAKDLGDGLATLGDMLSASWGQLQDAARSLVDVIGELARGAAPVGRALTTMVGGAVIGTIKAFAEGLKATTGFLAAHPGLIRAVGAAFAGWVVVSKVMAAAQALEAMRVALFVTRNAATGMTVAGAAVQRVMVALGVTAPPAAAGMTEVAAATDAARASLVRLAATTGVVAVVLGAAAALESVAAAAKKAKKETAEIDASAAGKGLGGLRDAYNQAARATQHFDGTINENQSTIGRFGRRLQFLGQGMTPFKNTVAESTQRLKEQQQHAAALAEKYESMQSVIRRLAYTYGITTGQVEMYLANDKKLNLATASTTDVQESMEKQLGKLAAATGTTKTSVAEMASVIDASGMSVEDFGKGLADAGDKAAGAVRSFADLSKVTDFKSPAPIELPKIDDIQGWYTRVLGRTASFSRDIAALVAQGYDPDLVTRFMQAGVEQAGPTVQALVDNYSTGLVAFVNAAEAKLQDFASRQAQLARVTYIATTAPTDQVAKDVSLAARIVQASWDENFRPASFAAKAGISVTDWNRIVGEFGLGVGKLQTAAGAADLTVTPKVDRVPFNEARRQITNDLFQINGMTLRPKVGLDLARLLADENVYDDTIARLTKDRKTMITMGADDRAIARVDAQIAMVTAARTAIVNAHGDPAAINKTDMDIDYLTRLRWAMIEAGAPQDKIDEVGARLNGLTVRRQALIDAAVGVDWASAQLNAIVTQTRTAMITALIQPGSDGTWRSSPATGAKGGFHAFARGGALSAGGFTRSQVVQFGEPETGGEAFIPRLGIDSTRAKKILDVAAGWHGMRVQPSYVGPSAGAVSTTTDRSVNVVFEAGAIQAGGADATGVADMVSQRLQFRLAGAGGGR